MMMMHLSRNIAQVVLLLLVVVATNNVVQAQAVCAINAECEYGTSCRSFDVQLRCNAPSNKVTGIFIQRFVENPTAPTGSVNTSPTPIPTFPPPPSSTAPATTPVTPATTAPTFKRIVLTAAPTNAPVTVATNVPTLPSNPCVGNGVGQTCFTPERPNIACCSSTKSGAAFNGCCSSNFGGLDITDTTIDGGEASCTVTGLGCSTTIVEGNDGSQELDFSGSGEPCKKVSEDPTCSNKQDDPTKNYGTCTNSGVEFDVCCPPGATGTFAVGDSCIVIVPGRSPLTGAPTISVVQPTESPVAPPNTDAPVVPEAPKVCSAYESCRNANLQGDCCPTIDGQFLGCCDGIDVDSSTTNALEPTISDPTNAPEPVPVPPEPIISDPTNGPEPVPVPPEPIISDPTNAPEPVPVPPELITSDQTNAPTSWSTSWSTTMQEPDATIQLFPASEILTKKPVTIPAATVPPTETNLRGDVAISLIEATSSAHTTSMMSKSLLSILLAMIIGASAL
ncbi:MAG: hypothetical protein ACI8RD_002779 [Bacillariaceae sp.]|jgi:hypothetical protein